MALCIAALYLAAQPLSRRTSALDEKLNGLLHFIFGDLVLLEAEDECHSKIALRMI